MNLSRRPDKARIGRCRNAATQVAARKVGGKEPLVKSRIVSRLQGRRLVQGGVALGLLIAVGLVVVPLTAAGSNPPVFTSGDLVVEVDQQTATGNIVDPVHLVDYSTTGTPSGGAVDLPTTQKGNNLPLVDYGGYENGGLITDSGDGGNIVLAGYEPSSATVIGGTAPGTDYDSPDVAGIVGSTGLVERAPTSPTVRRGPSRPTTPAVPRSPRPAFP